MLYRTCPGLRKMSQALTIYPWKCLACSQMHDVIEYEKAAGITSRGNGKTFCVRCCDYTDHQLQYSRIRSTDESDESLKFPKK